MIFAIAMMNLDRIHACLSQIYEPEIVPGIFERIQTMMNGYRDRRPRRDRTSLTQRDVILITYPDQVRDPSAPPLTSLARFGERYLEGLINGIHLLPFYPSSSDDGFSVIDYHAVDAEYGSWEDIYRLGQKFRLMFDAVINHASIRSAWFQSSLRGEQPYQDYFIRVNGSPDLSAVVRPRAQPLLTGFQTPRGKESIWTTFGPDQADLNYRNPAVLFDMLQVLLEYASKGATFLRLDAVAFLWKEFGTSCIHLPETHWIIRLVRAILEEVAPDVMLLTETNVPHADNLSYFGDGMNEAHLVYNFALPLLVLHSFHRGRADMLSNWATNLSLPSDSVGFFNILATHDGIGVNPVRGILSDTEIETLIRRVETGGGLVSQKVNTDGTLSAYELNVNYFDALNQPGQDENLGVQVDRFTTAHAILLALKGVPGIYFHSLFGSRGWHAGVAGTGRNRSINREKLDRSRLESELDDQVSLRAKIYARLCKIIKLRTESSAFSPQATQEILKVHDTVFALRRETRNSGQSVLCLHNVSPNVQSIECRLLSTVRAGKIQMKDLIGEKRISCDKGDRLVLGPYQSMWLTSEIPLSKGTLQLERHSDQ